MNDKFEHVTFKLTTNDRDQETERKSLQALEFLDYLKSPEAILSNDKAIEAIKFLYLSDKDKIANRCIDYNFISIVVDTSSVAYGQLVELISSTKPINEKLKSKMAVIMMLFSLIRSYTNYSIRFCTEFHKKNGISVLFDYLNSSTLIEYCLKTQNYPNSSEKVLMANLLRSVVGSLVNLSKVYSEYKDIWQACKPVDSLLSYAQAMHGVSDNQTSAFIAIANVAEEDEIERLLELKRVVPDIIKLINLCASQIKVHGDRARRVEIQLENSNEAVRVACVTHLNTVWHLAELLNALYHVAINDRIKYKIYIKFKLKEELNTIIFNGNDVEKEYSLKLLWQLCFDIRVGEEVIKDNDLYEYIVSLAAYSNLSEHVSESKVASYAKGILWLFNKKSSYINLNTIRLLNNKMKPTTSEAFKQESDGGERSKSARRFFSNPSSPVSPSKPKHIMISYNRFSRDLCLKVKSELEKLNYAVWIDVEKIHGSSLEAMANAVEQSFCVLVCMTEKYKMSPNCRAEAEYAFQINKPIVPLIMQENYKPDGWLGLILGAKIFVNFTKYEFDECMRRLMIEIKPLHQPEHSIVEANKTNTRPNESSSKSDQNKADEENRNTTNSVAQWSELQVAEWFGQIQVDSSIMNVIGACDGTLLDELYRIKREAPEYFYTTVSVGSSSLSEVAKFSHHLRRLFEKHH